MNDSKKSFTEAVLKIKCQKTLFFFFFCGWVGGGVLMCLRIFSKSIKGRKGVKFLDCIRPIEVIFLGRIFIIMSNQKFYRFFIADDAVFISMLSDFNDFFV